MVDPVLELMLADPLIVGQEAERLAGLVNVRTSHRSEKGRGKRADRSELTSATRHDNNSNTRPTPRRQA